ncbi:RNA polymerase sigma factor [Nocardioides maradonensis]
MTDAATPPPSGTDSGTPSDPDSTPDAPRKGRVRAARTAYGERVLAFDTFYRDSRDRLLVQTLALTGDLTAARSAVRDAYVVAWHHWRKIARQERPEDVVRSYAYRFGLRRRSARPWARRKDGDDDVRATLEALAEISLPQRKAVILTQLAGVDMEQAAREIGVPIETAERELAAGAALFAHDRQIPTTGIHQVLVDLERLTRTVTWPRITIIRRAGGARRRAHTLIGATAAVAVFAAAGAVVTDGSGLRPTLDREARRLAASGSTHGTEVDLPASSLLTAASVSRSLGKGWTLDSTTDNSTGNGLVQPCQSTRYADPHGTAALVRRFHTGTGARTATYLQSAEASTSTTASQRAYSRALAWFTACEPAKNQDIAKLPQTHLVSTGVVKGLGDQSAVVVLSTTAPSATYVVGVARTGQFTTMTSLRSTVPPARADRTGLATLLGTAVDQLCTLPGGGSCAPARAKVTDAPAFPIGSSSAFLSEIDLPAVGTHHGRLVGTTPKRVTAGREDTNVLGCDVVHLVKSYAGTPIHANLTRSFVFVASDLPKQTGLTQVVGALPVPRARAFTTQMAQQLTKCPGRNKSMGTHVVELQHHHGARTDLHAWRMSTELPGNRSVEYDVAIVRSGGALSQVIYVSAKGARMQDADFVALAQRALERITELPAY